MTKKNLTIFIASAVLVGALSFYGGVLYGKKSSVNRQNLAFSFGQSGQQKLGQGMMMGQPQNQNGGGRQIRAGQAGVVSGTIISKDEKSLTVKLPDGGSKIIFLSGSSQINKLVSGSLNDLIVGENIMASGSSNSDGSITAKMVDLRPASAASATSTPKQ